MKKNVLIWMSAAIAVSVCMVPVVARAQEAAPAGQEQPQGVTQADLARILVDQLGLIRFLPANPTAFECYAILMANGIAPIEGWVGELVVTRATLAQVIVQALGLTDKVADQSNPQAWIDVLTEMGISLETVGIATDVLRPAGIDKPLVVRNVFQTTEDTLIRREIPISEELVLEIFQRIAIPPIPPKEPITPTMPKVKLIKTKVELD